MTENPPEYYFAVPKSDYPLIGLYEEKEDIVHQILLDDVSSILYVGQDDLDEIVWHEPTNDFWDALVYINDYTSKMAEFHSTASTYGVEDGLPDSSRFKHPTNHYLPRYEMASTFNLSERLFHMRLETNTVFEDSEVLNQLFSRAFIESEGELPWYLREFENENENEKQNQSRGQKPSDPDASKTTTTEHAHRGEPADLRSDSFTPDEVQPEK